MGLFCENTESHFSFALQTKLSNIAPGVIEHTQQNRSNK